MRPRTQADLRMGPFTDGVNRFPQEATRKNCVEAFDVIGFGGDIYRRPAMQSFATAAPHMLPAGACRVFADAVELTDRAGNPEGVNVFYVGFTALSQEAFDGIEWSRLALTDRPWSDNFTLEVSYYDAEGAAWVVMPWVLDETIGWDTTGTYRCPLTVDGRISWHRQQLTGWGVANPVGGINGWWIRLRLIDSATDPASYQAPGAIEAPGIRIFQRASVNGLFPVRIEGQEMLVIGSCRRNRRGPEAGAMLGVKRQGPRPTGTLRLVVDEGGSVFGQITWTSWTRGGASLGTGGGTFGTASVITKVTQEVYQDGVWVPFEWVPNEFLGGVVAQAVGSALATTTSLPKVGILAQQFEHCRLRCTAAVTGGLSAGDTREIVYNGTTTLTLYPALGAAPVNAGDTFEIRKPPCLVLASPDGLLYELEANDEETLTPSVQPFARDDAAVALASWQGHHRILAEPRWVMDAGTRWSGVVDAITRRLVLTNGGPLLESDGAVLRPFEVDFESALALQIVGALQEDEGTELDPARLAKAKLRSTPPEGRYVAAYQNRMVVAGLRGRPFDITWSMPGAANRVWPYAFTTTIRDSSNNPLTGIKVLHDRLVAFTASTIHEATVPDAGGQISFSPAAQGIGFVANEAVVELEAGASVLLGVTPTGLAAWDGSDPRIVLDTFERVLPGGVNPHALHLSVAAVLPAWGTAFFAVPAAGSAVPNRILAVDYRTGAVWPWRCPFGVEALAVDYDTLGRARLLIGTTDGFVQTLVWGRTEDGETVTGEMVTRPEQPGKGEDIEIVRGYMTARLLGFTDTIGVQVVGEDDVQRPRQDLALYVDRGDPTFGAAGENWGTAQAWETRSWEERQIPVRATQMSRVALRVYGTAPWALRSLTLAWAPRGARSR